MQFKRTILAVTAATAVLSLAACDGTGGTTNTAAGAGSSPAAQPTSMAAPSGAMGQFGAACAAVPTSGPGSFQGMAQSPVATAASSNPCTVYFGQFLRPGTDVTHAVTSVAGRLS